MSILANKLYQRVTNFVFALAIIVSSLTVAIAPFLFSQGASAVSATVYDGIPSVQPPSYTSLGYQASSTKEFGDKLTLGSGNRQLSDITVSLTDWACENDYTKVNPTDPCTTTPGSSFTHPITVNLYNVSGGSVGSLLATKTQNVQVPYRPSADPVNCPSNPTKWFDATTSTCHNGYAFDVNFDFSAQNKTLPNDVIATVAYNTQSYGNAPIGAEGPYNSLNVSLAETAPTTGTDPNSDEMFWNTTYPGYTAGLKADSGWTPYHLAIEINANKIAAPNLLSPSNNDYVDGVSLTNSWSSVPGAVSYEYQSYNDAAKTSIRFTQTLAGTSKTATNVADATFWWNVRSIDSFGNKSDWSELWKVTVDHTKPAAPINGQPAITDTNNFYFTWDAVVDSGSPIVEYQFQSSGSNATSGGSLIGAWKNWEQGTGDQVFLPTPTIHSFGAGDGTYYWQARAIDDAGNPGAWSAVWTTVIDQADPVATITFPGFGPSATGFTVKYNEAVNPADAVNPANYFLDNWPVPNNSSGDLVGDATITYNPANTTATVTFTNSGWYISAEQKWGVQNIHDLAGNLISPNPTEKYSSPMVAPNAPTNVATTTPSTSLTLNWTWTAATDPGNEEASGVRYYQYALVPAGSGTPSSWTTTDNLSATTIVAADGSYELYVHAVDWAGNIGSNGVGTVVVDTTGPNVDVNDATFTSNVITITGDVDGDATSVDVVITDSDDNVVSSGPATHTDNAETWSYNVTLPNGTYKVTVTAKDALQNPSTAIANIIVNFQPAPDTGDQSGNTGGGGGTTVLSQTPQIAAQPAAVLGATTDTDGDSDVEGATDTNLAAIDTDATDGSIYGLAWYWWLLILLGLTGLTWGIIAGIRRRGQDS